MRNLGIQKMFFGGADDYALLFFGDRRRTDISIAAGLVSFDKNSESWSKFHGRLWSGAGADAFVVSGSHLYAANLMAVYRHLDDLGRVTDYISANTTITQLWKIPLDEGQGLTWQSLLQLESNHQVFSMVKGATDGEFVIGGQFLTGPGAASGYGFNSRRVARWNGTSWVSLGTGFGSDTFNNAHSVNALAFFSNDDIYAHFSTGASTTEIHRYDGTSWSLVGTAQNTSSLAMTMIKNDDGTLTVGGSFNRIGGITATRVAVYDPGASSSWSAPYEPGFNANVDQIKLGPTGVDMYFMGLFTNVQGVTANYLARKPKGTTAWVNLNNPSTNIHDGISNLPTRPNIFFNGSTLWACSGVSVTLTALGYLSSLTGPGSWTSRSLYAPYRIGGEAGVGTVNWLDETSTKMYTSYARRSLNDQRLAAGYCLVEGKNDYSSALTYNTKRMDRGDFFPRGNTAFTVTTESPSTNFFFLDDYQGVKNLYIGYGGSLSLTGIGVRSSYRWNGSDWSRWCYTNGAIFAVLRIGANIYLTGGGNFQDMINRIARWDGTNFSQLSSGLNGTGRALATDGTNLFVGGDFTTAGGVTVNRVAKWDPVGATWSALNTGTIGFNTGGVYALHWDATSSSLYAFGTFTTAGGITANRGAVWSSSSSTWSPIGGTGASGFNNSVLTMSVDPDNRHIYVAGSFSQVNTTSTPGRIVRWNIPSSTYETIGTNIFNYSEQGMISIDNLSWDSIKKRLYASGQFRIWNSTYNNRAYFSMCYWDGTNWNPIKSAGVDTYSGSGAGRAIGRILAVRTRDIPNFNKI